MKQLTFFLMCVLTQAIACSAVGSELSVRVRDADTRQPLSARFSIRAADGTYPDDRIGLSRDKWPNIEAHGVFSNGDTTVALPDGAADIVISAGPQYIVERRQVEIKSEPAALEVFLKRRTNLRERGWVCGDAHLHMIHGEMQRKTSYAEVATTCRANGLDWAYVGQEYVGAGEQTLAAMQANCREQSSHEFRLMLGGERPKSLLGHHALIGIENPFVIPDDPPYHRAARQIHDQGGVLFPVHPLRYYPGKQYLGEWLDFPGNNLGRELLFDALLGPSFDGLSVLSDEPHYPDAHQLWFNLLNQGCFVPAFADSDACFDRPTLGKNVPGFWATYLYVGPKGQIDNQSLADAVRQGRTTATTGPLVLWDIAGKLSGDTLPLDGAERKVTIEALHAHHNWTIDEARIAKVELLRNGKVVRVWEPNTPDAKLALTIQETEPCWYAVRVFGTDYRWQVAMGSPIYFAKDAKSPKQPPMTVRVRGRIYDFVTGEERTAKVTVARGPAVLRTFEAAGQFAVDMPLDATITANDETGRTLIHDLLMDYGPVHRFLWQLDSETLAKPETFERLQALVREVELEFPLGHRMSGCYAANELTEEVEFEALRVLAGPVLSKATSPEPAIAMILLDKQQVKAGDEIQIAVVAHLPAVQQTDGVLGVECRAYDPNRPSGFNPLKVCSSAETKWSKAIEAGNGYRVLLGKLKVSDWVEAGPVGEIEINALLRAPGGKFLSHVGLRLPLGETKPALMAASNWPSVPISWPDHNYGIGPLKVCGKIGRAGQPTLDYRELKLTLATSAGTYTIDPLDDCRGCADADDAVYEGQYFDQILNEQSKLLPPLKVRKQPSVNWRESSVIDATGSP